MALTACAPTEVDDIFDESAAKRLDKAVADYKNYFADKGGKWVMKYFCNEEEPGYTFVITFDKNGSVTVAGDNSFIDGYKSDVSLWDVIADNGPVLTFNTYNTVLHTFSDPADIPSTSTRETGRGHEGDYEFMIIKTEDERCELRGKKTSYTIIMDRIPSDVDDAEYMASVTKRINTSFSPKIDSIYLETGNGKKFVIFNAVSRIWSFYPYGGDAVSQTEVANCIVTADGIRFLYPLDFIQDYDSELTVAIQNFKFMDDGTLLCIDDEATRIYGDGLASIFLTPKITWASDKAEMGGQFFSLYEAIETGVPEVFGKTSSFGGYSLSYNAKTERLTMRFLSGRNGKTAGNIYFNVVKVDEQTIRLSFDVEDADAADNNGRQHYNRLEPFKQLVDLLTSAEYTLSADNVMCPTPMKVTSKANAADYLMLTF